MQIKVTKTAVVQTAVEAVKLVGDIETYPINEIRLVSEDGDKIIGVEELTKLAEGEVEGGASQPEKNQTEEGAKSVGDERTHTDAQEGEGEVSERSESEVAPTGENAGTPNERNSIAGSKKPEGSL